MHDVGVALLQVGAAMGIIIGAVAVRQGRRRQDRAPIGLGAVTVIWGIAGLVSHLPGAQVPDVVSVLMLSLALLALCSYSVWMAAHRRSQRTSGGSH